MEERILILSVYFPAGGGVSVPWGGYAGVGVEDNMRRTNFKLALYRFDNNGDTIWTRAYTDTVNLVGWVIKVARDNRYLLGCNWEVQKTSYFYTPTVILADSFGNILWQKTYKADIGHIRFLLGIDTCKDGGYVICAGDYDTNYPGKSAEEILIIKTDSAGNPQWTSFIPPPYYNIEGNKIISLKTGGYIVCGTQGTKNNWPDNYPLLYITKLNDIGGIIWSNAYGYPPPPEVNFAYLYMVRELPNGEIIACGQEADIFDDTLKGCILKLDSNGNQKWLRYYVMDSPAQDYMFDIEPTSDGGYITTGCAFVSPENTWAVKTDSLGCSDSAGCNYSTGITELRTKSEELRVFPNPSSGVFTMQLAVGSGQLAVEVYNVMGEKITPTLLPQSRGGASFSCSINLSGQPNGVYFYRVITENGNLVGDGKIIIQR